MFIPWAAFQFCWKVGKSCFKLGQTSKENSESGQEFYQLPLSKQNLLVLEIYSFRLIVKISQRNFSDHRFLLIFIDVLLLSCFRQTWPHNIQHTSEELPTSSFKWKAAAFVSRLLILTQCYWCGLVRERQSCKQRAHPRLRRAGRSCRCWRAGGRCWGRAARPPCPLVSAGMGEIYFKNSEHFIHKLLSICRSFRGLLCLYYGQ